MYKRQILKTKAPGQHAHYIEARNGILRHTMHLIETDLKRSDIIIPFSRLLGEAIFVVNAFTFYNGCSPYNAVFGRQPACLPDLENIDFDKEGENSDGLREARIRQTSIAAIMQSTAESKVKTALKAKTTLDGAKLYAVGDMVDYHRQPSGKDYADGWHGPVSYTHLTLPTKA